MSIAKENIKDGMEVVYEPSPGVYCHGFVDGEPWQLGHTHGTWVVRLRGMDPTYSVKTGKHPTRDWVNAASLQSLEFPQ